MKNYIAFLTVGFFLISCHQKENVLHVVCKLPSDLKEVSGISYAADTQLFWTLEDSGNENKIYGIDIKGSIVKTVKIENTKNIDWEDITKDIEGNLYIGDFGNNENKRTDLCIYKIEKESLGGQSVIPSSKISFSYPEQKEFPPKKKELFYDVESFFELNGNFYLFTKNRSKNFDGTVFIYKIPNASGTHTAQLIGQFQSCDDYNNCAITSAAISPDQTKVVLLSHSKIWLFQNFTTDNFLSGFTTITALQHYSQKEAICFKDNETLYIADEKVKKTGGKLYEISVATLLSKAKP